MHAPINHIDDTYATWHLHLHTEFVPSNDTQKEETPEMVAEGAISADDKYFRCFWYSPLIRIGV